LEARLWRSDGPLLRRSPHEIAAAGALTPAADRQPRVELAPLPGHDLSRLRFAMNHIRGQIVHSRLSVPHRSGPHSRSRWAAPDFVGFSCESAALAKITTAPRQIAASLIALLRRLTAKTSLSVRRFRVSARQRLRNDDLIHRSSACNDGPLGSCNRGRQLPRTTALEVDGARLDVARGQASLPVDSPDLFTIGAR
jgi:hypothetical protein